MSELSEREERRIVAAAGAEVDELCSQEPESLIEAARAWKTGRAAASDTSPHSSPDRLTDTVWVSDEMPVSWRVLPSGRVVFRDDKNRLWDSDSCGFAYEIDVSKINKLLNDRMLLAEDGLWIITYGGGLATRYDYRGLRALTPGEHLPSFIGGNHAAFGGDIIAMDLHKSRVVAVHRLGRGGTASVTNLAMPPHMIMPSGYVRNSWDLHPDGVVYWDKTHIYLAERQDKRLNNGDTRHRVLARRPRGMIGNHLQCRRDGFFYLQTLGTGKGYCIRYQPWPKSEELFREPKWYKPVLWTDARTLGATSSSTASADNGLRWLRITMVSLFIVSAIISCLPLLLFGVWFGTSLIPMVPSLLFWLFANHGIRANIWKKCAPNRVIVDAELEEDVKVLPQVVESSDAALVKEYLDHVLTELRERHAGDQSVIGTNIAEYDVKERRLQTVIRKYEARIAGKPAESVTVFAEAKSRMEGELAQVREARAKFTGARGVIEGYLEGCVASITERTSDIELLREGSEVSESVRELLERSERDLAREAQAVQKAFARIGEQVNAWQAEVVHAMQSGDSSRGQLADFQLRLDVARLPPVRSRVEEPAVIVPQRIEATDITDAEFEESLQEAETYLLPRDYR